MKKEHTANNTNSFTLRSVIIAIVLIPFNSYWVLYLSYVWDSNRPASLALLFNVIFLLLVLMVINVPLRRFTERGLSQTELLTIYAMLCQATVFAGRDMVQVLVPLMGNGFWYATLENEWAELFHQYLPDWLVVSNSEILRGFYEGESTLYIYEHIEAWIKPVLIWTGFSVVLSFVFFCINVILRKQWQEHEKLTYPIVQLPLEMTNFRKNFFANRLMWVGAAIAGVLNLLYSLHQIFPSVPAITLYTQITLSDKPWNAMNTPGFRFGFFPFAIGIGFLIPLDLAFSCWFFHLFWHFERVIGSMFGWRAVGFPNEFSQIRGVWIGMLVFVIWMGRKHFKAVFKRAVLGHGGIDDSEEAMTYRSAVLGTIVGLILIMFFCMHAGMSAWIALLFFGLYFAMSVIITRIRAELGPPAHDLYNAGPDLILADSIGTRRLGRANLSVMTMFFWLNHLAYRGHPMPHQLEALKLAHQTKINRRGIFIAIILAVALAMISASWGHLHISYNEIGLEQGDSWYARSAFNRLASWVYSPSGTNVRSLWFSLGGFVFAIVLLIMRLRFLWWPLHPVGYVVSSWWTFTGLWFPILISWIIKNFILSYSGVKGYRKVTPFFLGLILGDVIVTSIISILGIFLNFRVVYLSW